MDKPWNNKAWLFVLPVFVLVAISAIIPLMTVVNYSLQDTFGGNEFFWAGTEWYEDVLGSSRFHDALLRNLAFSAIVLAIEIPLGIAIALSMPRKGIGVPVCLILMALPLLIPWNVVGTIWQVFGRADIGLLGYTLAALGVDYNYATNPVDAWVTIVIMDVWHWTSLVVLLCYSGLVAIPEAYYQAARIDGASKWKVFRYIQLPKMQRVLLIAVLLRFMDSFMIYTEPFVLTGGGPGNSTTFLSIDLVKMAIGQFDLGPAAAMSIVYFLIILLLSWVFYTVMENYGRDVDDGSGRVGGMSDAAHAPPAPDGAIPPARTTPLDGTKAGTGGGAAAGALSDAAARTRAGATRKRGFGWLVPTLYIGFLMLPIYWLVNMSFKTNREILSSFTLWPQNPTLRNYEVILTDPSWYMGYVNSTIYVVMNMVIAVAVALPAAYAFSRYRFLGDKHMFFWLLTNRMAPPAVFVLPFFQLYSAFGLFDTHIAVALAHCLFNVPLAVWILEGFMSGVPREIDETAYIDGYSFPRFFRQDLHAADRQRHRGRRVLLLHVQLGGAADREDADRDRGEADHRDDDEDGVGVRARLGRAGRRRRADHHPGRARDLLRQELHRQGLRPG